MNVSFSCKLFEVETGEHSSLLEQQSFYEPKRVCCALQFSIFKSIWNSPWKLRFSSIKSPFKQHSRTPQPSKMQSKPKSLSQTFPLAATLNLIQSSYSKLQSKTENLLFISLFPFQFSLPRNLEKENCRKLHFPSIQENHSVANLSN
jgi:hypothetical protein